MAGATYGIGQLADVQRAWVAGNLEAGVKAMRDAARRSMAYYVKRTAEEKAVDTGHMRNAFASDDIPMGAQITNAAPYFSVIDQGRRPGATMPPFGAIYDWVLRKRIVGETRAAVTRNRKRIGKHTLGPRASGDISVGVSGPVAPSSIQDAAVRLTQAIRFAIKRRGIRARAIATDAQAPWISTVRPSVAVLGFIVEAIDRAMRARPRLPTPHGGA